VSGSDGVAGVAALSQMLHGHERAVTVTNTSAAVHTILDVGCGAGVLRRYLPTDQLSSYLGVDPIAAAIEQARVHADERSEFRQVDPMCAELGEFDVVVCNEVLYFADDPLALADRAGRFVRPGGHLLVSIWRHPGDTLLWRHLQQRYETRDRVAVVNGANRFAPRGWLVGCLRRPEVPPPAE